ncbi:MAG: HAMP domain-containing histidine kinase [Chloroflexota bacterium]|nr:HAMP domain-containing histidine kinase [Chloroflexota bacterium]
MSSATVVRARDSVDTRSTALVASPAVRILIVTALLCLPIVALAILAAPGDRPIWDNLHSSISAIGAALASAWSVRTTSGRVRTVRTFGAIALGLWMLATLAWAAMTLTGTASVPSIVDVLVIAIAVPAAGVVIWTVHGRLSSAEEAGVYIDGALGLVLVGSVVVFVFGPTTLDLPTAPGIAALLYPTGFLGIGIAGGVALLAVGYPIAARGAFALMVGITLVGLAYLGWISPAMTLSDPGELSNLLFTSGTLLWAFGSATWRSERSTDVRYLAFARSATRIIGPLIVSLLIVMILLPAPESVDRIIRALGFGGAILLIVRQGLIVRERTAMLTTVTELTHTNRRLVDELRRELEERTRNESRSIEAARADAVGSLSASVGHEVNNPLTGVLGYAELVLAELPADHPSRPDVEQIQHEALRARDIVRSLRDYASPILPHLEPTDVSKVLRRTVAATLTVAPAHGIEIEESYEAIGLVALDGHAVERSVGHILANAVRATPPGGRVSVASRRDVADIVITVTDDGIGMNEATALRAFEPFFTGWPTTSVAAQASGRGLSIGSGLIGSLGGKITLDTEPGRGTMVTIRLPADDALDVSGEALGGHGS